MPSAFALAVLALAAASPSEAEAGVWHTYTNPRFGVSADVPAILVGRDEPPVNADGQGFTTADGRAHLIVFGSYKVDHEMSAQLMAERKEPGTSYIYQKAAKDRFVLSGTHGGRITYVRCHLGLGDVIGCVYLEYPADDAAKCSEAVDRISISLRVP